MRPFVSNFHPGSMHYRQQVSKPGAHSLSLIAALPLGLTAFARKFHFLDFRAAAGHPESLLQLMYVCHH